LNEPVGPAHQLRFRTAAWARTRDAGEPGFLQENIMSDNGYRCGHAVCEPHPVGDLKNGSE